MPPEEKLRVAVLASGRGSNLQALIDAAKGGNLGVRISLVLSDRKDAVALDRARRHGIREIYLDPAGFRTREAYDDQIVEHLKKDGIGLVVLAGYMRIVTSRLIDAFRARMINIHPSLLPAFPGLRAQRQALEWGAKISGCSVHFVEEEVDNGPIIIQAAVPVFKDDTEESLGARILEQEHRILPQAVGWIAAGRVKLEGRRVRIEGALSDSPGVIVSPPDSQSS